MATATHPAPQTAVPAADPSTDPSTGGVQELIPEIRAARPEEREQAWELQRAAFNLSADTLLTHPGVSEQLRVAVCGARVVSCLTVIRADLWLRGTAVTMGGVRHVATHPEEQNRGYASALMRDTLAGLRQQGVATSVLFPFSFRYYRKFGYELGGNHCQFWCRPNCIPAYAERRSCRRGRREDCLSLADYYARRGRESACLMARDPRRWEALCSGPQVQSVLYRKEDSGEIGGYALTTEGRDSYGGRVLRVLDLTAETPGGWRALLGHLSQSPVESLEWYASSEDLAASGLLRSPAPLREGFKPRGIATVRPLFQFRVVDLEAALRARLPAFPGGQYDLALRVKDDLLPENGRPITLSTSGQGTTLRPPRAEDPALEADIRIFSQLFCGYMSPSEAVSQGLASCSSPEALETADALFPTGDPFISEVDRF